MRQEEMVPDNFMGGLGDGFRNVTVVEAAEDHRVYSLLLIGTSGSGKSTLGNFLVDDQVWERYPPDPTFEMGNGIRSCTRVPASKIVKHKYLSGVDGPDVTLTQKTTSIRITDTPGIGDTRDDVTDSRLMETMFEELCSSRNNEVACAVLVVEMPTLFDAQCKSNLLFYQNLLRGLFRRNIVIVVTHMSQTPSARKKMSFSGVDPDDRLKEMQQEIKTSLLLGHDIPIFTIESLCLDKVDKMHAQQVRQLLFDRCVSIPGIAFATTLFPKPPSWQATDLLAIEELNGESIGTRDGIISALNLDPANQFWQAYDVGEKLRLARSLLDVLQRELDEKDNDGLVLMSETPHTDTWHFFSGSSANFDIHTPFEIKDLSVSGGAVKFTTEEATYVAGSFSRGVWKKLNATLTLSTYNRIMFRKDIEQLERQIKSIKSNLYENQQRYTCIKSEAPKSKKALKEFKQFLKSQDRKILMLERKFLTLEEIRSRTQQGQDRVVETKRK
jgi:GTPase SAR1 family protein